MLAVEWKNEWGIQESVEGELLADQWVEMIKRIDRRKEMMAVSTRMESP